MKFLRKKNKNQGVPQQYVNTPPEQQLSTPAEFNNDKQAVKIITLSGTETVTKNLTIYECGEDIIIVDCGIGFPDSEMLGIDVVIPDMTYIIANSHKVRGLLITHAHEDHLGAVPYLLQQIKVPIYSGKLVQGFLTEKLKDNKFKSLANGFSFHLMTPETPQVTLGNFKIEAFKLNHSVPDAVGFAITTPQGRILHMADYKIDWTPVLDRPIDLGKIARYGEDGVLCLVSDCLNVTTEGYSKSESSLTETFHILFSEYKDHQIFVTTISSNLSRMYQIIEAAIQQNKKVVLSGRSIEQSATIGNSLGYLPFDENVFIPESDAADYPQNELVYIIAGCYGQQGSALDRLSRSEHEDITLEKNAVVIFSADPNPPGVEVAVDRVMGNLTLNGAEVIYGKIQNNLHVSGHGVRGDLTIIAAITKPRYFIPIGGTIIKMRAYKDMVGSLKMDRDSVFELLEGDGITISNGYAKREQRIETKQVYIDGSSVGDVGPIVMKDREQLSTDGVFVVIVPKDINNNLMKDKVDIVTRGFIYVKESRTLLEESKQLVARVIDKNAQKVDDWGFIKRRIENEMQRFLFKETGREPMIIVYAINS